LDGHVTDTEWTAEGELQRGIVYRWVLVIHRPNNNAEGVQKSVIPQVEYPPPKFRILTKEELDCVERLEKQLKGSHLALFALYVDFGLFEDAEREMRTLDLTNPASDVPKQLLKSLDQLRRIGSGG
jgi:hypothetical protein